MMPEAALSTGTGYGQRYEEFRFWPQSVVRSPSPQKVEPNAVLPYLHNLLVGLSKDQR